MGTPGPQKINRCGVDFKLKAVQMSNHPGVLIKDVAESLCIHPFMLSKWRTQVRDGELLGKPAPLERAAVAELRRLGEVEQQFKRHAGMALKAACSTSTYRSRASSETA